MSARDQLGSLSLKRRVTLARGSPLLNKINEGPSVDGFDEQGRSCSLEDGLLDRSSKFAEYEKMGIRPNDNGT